MNPFTPTALPISKRENLKYRQTLIAALESKIKTPQQTYLTGVEGSGKTSLLKSTFNFEYRKQKALENVLITPVVEFPDDLTSEAVYVFYVNTLMSSLDILTLFDNPSYQRLIDECEAIRNDTTKTPQAQFNDIRNKIGNNGFHMVMVVDNFERFVLSPNVQMKHHETLCKQDQLPTETIQFIVATNYDFNKSSLPPGTSGSFFLSRFGDNCIRVGGFSLAETKEYIRQKLSDRRISTFSDALITEIYELSGGIPTVLEAVAKSAYDYIDLTGGEEGWQFESTAQLDTLFNHWCCLLSDEQLAAVKALLDGNVTAENHQHLVTLSLRGAMNSKIEKDMFGNIRIKDTRYDFCCKLLKQRCSEDGWLESVIDRQLCSGGGADSMYIVTAQKLIGDKLDEMADELESLRSEKEADVENKLKEYRPLNLQINSPWRKKLAENLKAVKAFKARIDSEFDALRNRLIEACENTDELKRIELDATEITKALLAELNKF